MTAAAFQSDDYVRQGLEASEGIGIEWVLIIQYLAGHAYGLAVQLPRKPSRKSMMLLVVAGIVLLGAAAAASPAYAATNESDGNRTVWTGSSRVLT